MAKTKSQSKKKREASHAKRPKISPIHCPKDMSLKEWQRALRKQAAQTEIHRVEMLDDTGCYFEVINPKSCRCYRVDYFGENAPLNRCECMDFRTNQLGTCKHIESVSLYRNGRYATVRARQPEHSSVVVNYPAGRTLQLRIGKYKAEEMQRAASDIFDKYGVLIHPDCDPSDFIRRAKEIDPEFSWEDEALNLILAARDKKRRLQLIKEKYAESDLSGLIKTKLHPYQVEGVKFAVAGGRTINADEMGLGKTVQAIATAELMRKEGLIHEVIVICPTSLKYQWYSEIKRFTDSSVIVVEGNPFQRKQQFENPAYFYKICSFHAITNNVKAGFIPVTDMIIFDELQRLKNWDTQMGRQLRKLTSEYVLALSGTPLENKLNELYSVTQFVDQFLLGPLYKFTNDTTLYDENGRIIGYKNLHTVANMISNTLLRRRKADVKIQMPKRTDTNMFVPMTKEQRAIHSEYQHQVSILIDKWKRFKYLSESDRKRLLLFLSMMRMVCDSTFILDQKSRHDTKIDEIKEIIRNMLDSSEEKVVIFSQWERMLRILSQELEKEGIDFCILHGGVPSAKRKDLINRFREDPDCRIFLSTDAGSTGLNLQSASLLINIDLPWNPAVLEQRIARIYRLGQQNPVQIINMVASNTIEERMLATLRFKSNLSAGILDGGQDAVFLDNNKFSKIVDIAEEVVTEEDQSELESSKDYPEECAEDELSIQTDNQASTEPDSSHIKKATDNSRSFQSNPLEDNPNSSNREKHAGNTNTTSKKPQSSQEMREFVAGGIYFLGTLANILKEPEGAKNLADALVKEDPTTGNTSLNIPVPDKDTIVNLFASIATLIGK